MEKELMQNLKNQIEEWEDKGEIISVREKNEQGREGIIATSIDGKVKVYWSDGAADGSDDIVIPFEEFADRFEITGTTSEEE